MSNKNHCVVCNGFILWHTNDYGCCSNRCTSEYLLMHELSADEAMKEGSYDNTNEINDNENDIRSRR